MKKLLITLIAILLLATLSQAGRVQSVKKMPGCLMRISAYFGKQTRTMKLLFKKQPAFPDSLVVTMQDSTVVYKLKEEKR